MKLNLKFLHTNYLNKSNIRQTGKTTDILVALIQSCEVDYGDYCYITQTNMEDLVVRIEELAFIVSNLMVHEVSFFERKIVFDNGSSIYFHFIEEKYFNNIYFDIDRSTPMSIFLNWQKMYEKMCRVPMPEKVPVSLMKLNWDLKMTLKELNKKGIWEKLE